MDKADCALIGGEPMQRVVIATQLRRQGVSVFTELSNRKLKRMYQRAVQETWRGARGVADVTDEIGLTVVASVALDGLSDD